MIVGRIMPFWTTRNTGPRPAWITILKKVFLSK